MMLLKYMLGLATLLGGGISIKNQITLGKDAPWWTVPLALAAAFAAVVFTILALLTSGSEIRKSVDEFCSLALIKPYCEVKGTATDHDRAVAEKAQREADDRRLATAEQVRRDNEVKKKADEAERQRLAAAAKAEQTRRDNEAKEKADEAERQRIAAIKAEVDRKASEANAKLDAEEAVRRDPAKNVIPGSGQSFQDKQADGSPCPMCPKMVVVPAGNFTMGSPDSEPERYSGERQAQVVIGQPFAVGLFAVTFDEWNDCVVDSGCNSSHGEDPGGGHGKYPVVWVDWSDAKSYVAWLSRKTGKTYRLLSEADREYVARAGSTTPFWWGKSITSKQAAYDVNRAYGGARLKDAYWQQQVIVPVDSFEANPWGLYNVHGNVWEWTEDCWNDSNNGNPGNGRARTSGDCSRRVVRGGSWHDYPRDLRSASRKGDPADITGRGIGFRVGRTLTP